MELVKGSLNTFLNAMTFNDKTVYPVSSRNKQDFLNLVNVYMDAVLHPAAVTKSEIFRQEGWRYYCRVGILLRACDIRYGRRLLSLRR